MAELQSAELKRLGVPFFGVRPNLMLPDDDKSPPSEETDPASDKPAKVGVTKKQLLELQRKMLNHLMELYGD